MRYQDKMNKYQRTEFQKKKLSQSLAGSGRYLYRNNTSGGLMLPKPDLGGSRNVPFKGTFIGDSYFMAMVNTHELRLVQELEAPKGAIMNEQTLILDQPPTITTDGIVEHQVKEVLMDKKKKLNEKKTLDSDVLLNEDPLQGVEILTG